jgi:hypothetical protein
MAAENRTLFRRDFPDGLLHGVFGCLQTRGVCALTAVSRPVTVAVSTGHLGGGTRFGVHSVHRPLSYDPGSADGAQWSATMADAAAPWATTISAMASAFLVGDNADGEELLLAALDLGAPWDVATAAAARALTGHQARTNAPNTPDGLITAQL